MELSKLLANNSGLSSIPHSLSLEKESNSDYKVAYMSRMLDWREATKGQAMAAYRESPEYGRTQEYIRYLENNGWDKRRPMWRSQYQNNKMGLARRDRLAKISDSKPIIGVNTSVDMMEDAASCIEQVIRAEWIKQDMGGTLMTAYDIALLNGNSFCKIGAGKNKLRLTALGPDQVIPIQPSLESIQDSAAVLHRCWKPISYFHKMFPFTSAGIEAGARSLNNMGRGQFNRPESMDQTTWDGLGSGMKRVLGVAGGSAPSVGEKYYGVCELEEYWVEDFSRNESSRTVVMKDPFLPMDQHNWHYEVKPGDRLYPRKRLIIFGGPKLVYDGPSPFWHGMYPFACMWTNKVPWSFYGLSLYRDLLPMQRLLNEIPAGISDMVAKALNPAILTKTSTVGPAAFKTFNSDMPGARLILNSNVDDINKAFVWQKPPEIPSFVPQLLQGVLNPEFDRLAGNVDVNSLANKNQMAGGDTIDSMRDSLQTSLRREERFVESFLNDCGKQAVSHIIQFYDVKQRMKLLGEDGVTDQDFLYDPGKLHPGKKEFNSYFWKMFDMQVQPGSLHSGAHDASKAEAIGLAARGLISRREMFRRMKVDPGHANKILEELVEEQQVVAAMQGGAGGTRTPRPPDQSDHSGLGV